MLLVQDGVLTRTVRETAELLDLLAGAELGDMTWAPPPSEPFAEAARRTPGKLRIAMSALSPVPEAEVDPVAVQAMRDAGALLESLGHEVVEADPPWARPELSAVFTASFGPAVCTQIRMGELLAGRAATAEDMEPMSWALYELCKGISSIDAQLAEFQLHGVGRELITWVAQYDALLTPSLAEAPVTLGTLDPMNTDEPLAAFTRSASFTPYTPPCNISGQPAISLPLYQREDGLPLGVQLIGQPEGEGALLALAAQLEEAHGWAERRPSL
jgi:amidase